MRCNVEHAIRPSIPRWSLILTSLVLFSLLAAVLACSMQLGSVVGTTGASATIDESMKRGVFHGQYVASVRLDDSAYGEIEVRCAWIERHWFYGNPDPKKTVVDTGYQVTMVLAQPARELGRDLRFGELGSGMFRILGDSMLIADLVSLPTDTLIWPIHNLAGSDPWSTGHQVGTLMLARLDTGYSRTQGRR